MKTQWPHTSKLGRGTSLGINRVQNLNALLSAIWENAPISRSELASITGLAPSSVTRLIRDLEGVGLVQQMGKEVSSGGRQRVLLSPSPQAGLIIGIDMSGTKLRGGVFDSANKLLVRLEQPFAGVGPEAIEAQLVEFITTLLNNKEIDPKDILGIGISVPSTVDEDRGTIIMSFNLRLYDYPIRDILQKAFNLPIYVEVDSHSAALGEKYFGAGRHVDDLIYLLIATGVGMGPIIDGQIYHGKAGMASFAGHIIIDRTGPVCLCGKRGCLEAVASAPAILHNARHLLTYSRAPILMEVVGDNTTVSLEHILTAAEQGCTLSGALIANAADQHAYAISLMTSILNINWVIVGGDVPRHLGQRFMNEIIRALEGYQRNYQPITVVPAQLEQHAFAKGVAMLTLLKILGLYV